MHDDAPTRLAELDAARAGLRGAHEVLDRRRHADPELEHCEVVGRMVVAVQPGHEAGDEQQRPVQRKNGRTVRVCAQPGLRARSIRVAISPGGGHQFGDPLVAVLVQRAEGEGIRAVTARQQLHRQPVVERGAFERAGGVGRKQDQRDPADHRLVHADDEAGQALVEDTRSPLVAGVVELAHRPRRVRARAQRKTGMRIALAETVQVEPRARDQHDRFTRFLERRAHRAGQAQHAVLLARGERGGAVAEAQRTGLRRTAEKTAGKQQRGEQRPLPAPLQPGTGTVLSSRCQSSSSTRKKASCERPS